MKGDNRERRFKAFKVEEFFAGCQSWATLDDVDFVQFDQKANILELKSAAAADSEDVDCSTLLIQFPVFYAFRVRFNPAKSCLADYPSKTNRTIAWQSLRDLAEEVGRRTEFTVDCVQLSDRVDVITRVARSNLCNNNLVPFMRVEVRLRPYQLKVYRFQVDSDVESCYEIHSDAVPSIYYTLISSSSNRNNKNNNSGTAGLGRQFTVVQAKMKHQSSVFSGFGTHGFTDLCKQSLQLNFFNYDNARFNQFYGDHRDNREPLYHSDPFFMCLGGGAACQNLNTNRSSSPAPGATVGIFIDNLSQTLIDVGVTDSSSYMFGSVHNDLDYYVYVGDSPRDVIAAHTMLVGRSHLSPRWALGYHQGCFGYTTRHQVESVVRQHRRYGIPLDGLHLDVDLQKDFRTFTIDTDAFPDPDDMFDWLARNGIKCSTNITPFVRKTENGYGVYDDGVKGKHFVVDARAGVKPGETVSYSYFDGGSQHIRSATYAGPTSQDGNANYFKGEVYYGVDDGRVMGAVRHYPNMFSRETREWWGRQYEYLYGLGLEMVWQDMTTPCIRKGCGDMASFPMNLLVECDVTRRDETSTAAVKVPIASVWNLYSFNLHKATYHGLNRLYQSTHPEFGGKLRAKRTLRCRDVDGSVRTLNKRNFIIGRGGYTGLHRFAAMWTGDNVSNWDYLRYNLVQVLAVGLGGQGICGGDVGGFEPDTELDKWADPELMIRWVGCGAFLPWFRNHYIKRINKKYFQELYEYELVLNGPHRRLIPDNHVPLYRSVLPACRYAVELRYRLMQLFYDYMCENTLNGMPIARAMFLNVDGALPPRVNAAFLNNQFFVGDDLLIAPVLHKGQTHRDVYLPDVDEHWYHFKDGRQPLDRRLRGGTIVRRFDAGIRVDDPDHIPSIVPVYVRAGAVIPTVEREQWVGERRASGRPNPVTINIYPGLRRGRGKDSPVDWIGTRLSEDGKVSERGAYMMFQDDGLSRESASTIFRKLGAEPLAEGRCRVVTVDHTYDPDDAHKRLIAIRHRHIDPQDRGYSPEHDQFMFVAILHDPEELENCVDSGPLERITINGVEVTRLPEDGSAQDPELELKKSGANAWYYNESVRTSFLKVFDDSVSSVGSLDIHAFNSVKSAPPCTNPVVRSTVKHWHGM